MRATSSRRDSTPKVAPLRVLLLDDSERDAERIRQELQQAGIATLAERVDSEDTFASALRYFAPDVVLANHSLARFDGQAALALVRKVAPKVPLIIVTCSANAHNAVSYLRAGAEDLINKENLDRLAASLTEAVRARRPLEKLSPRQIQVLRMVAEGQRTREIGARLNVSVKTVESHRSQIMKRLKMHDIAGLVRYAVRVGLVVTGAEVSATSNAGIGAKGENHRHRDDMKPTSR